MFAIFFTEAMDPFYNIILTFPVIVFTCLLILFTFFGLIAVLGLIDLDFLNFDGPDIDGGLDGSEGLTSSHVLAGIMMRLGLVGIPMPLVFFLVSLIGWILSFLIVEYTFHFIPDGIVQFIVALAVLVGVLYAAAMITGKLLNPFRDFFKTAHQEVQKVIVGQSALVRTSIVNTEFGEATVNDGGAGLIVKVRSYKSEEEFKRGDKIVLLEYVAEENIYKVISEQEFKI
ncbi:hypothetical protein TDB9533_04735 [Thalassocella blandensis]|nr:hypothetical protein TDB9533_04735 [Thalassocella blandensis]